MAVWIVVSGAIACAPDSTAPAANSSETLTPAANRGAVAATTHQHEPVGYSPAFDNRADGLPPVTAWYTGSVGAWRMNYSSTAGELNDAAAPCSPPGVWFAKYRSGLKAGSGPVTLYAQKTSTQATESRRWYVRACIRVGRAGQYENQATGTKLWFASVGDAPGPAHCSVVPMIKGDAVQAVKSTWTAGATFECSGVLPTVRFLQIPSAGRPIKADVWQVHEWLIDAGDIDKTNGRFQWWIDGNLVLDRQNQKFRTNQSGFYHGLSKWRWAPTWGGTVGTRTRDDYYLIDDVYVSGSGKP